MEVNLNLVNATRYQSSGSTVDPQYLSGLANAIKASLEGGPGVTSLQINGKVFLLELLHPLTYDHFSKLVRWLGFLAPKKIKLVYQNYTAAKVTLSPEVVDDLRIWIGRCRAFLDSLISSFPNRRIRHLPWGEETSRWTVSEQVTNALADDNHLQVVSNGKQEAGLTISDLGLCKQVLTNYQTQCIPR